MNLLPHPYTMAYTFSWVLLYTLIEIQPLATYAFSSYHLKHRREEQKVNQTKLKGEISDSKHFVKENPWKKQTVPFIDSLLKLNCLLKFYDLCYFQCSLPCTLPFSEGNNKTLKDLGHEGTSSTILP